MNYTHIHILLDRTGSMDKIRDDTIGGFNAFLREQKALPGKATFSLVQFDSQDPYEVIHSFKPIDQVSELTRETFIPRAMTPLLDAIGRTINDLESYIKGLEGRNLSPDRVVVVIITDGHENASREFSVERVHGMIKEKKELEKWQFVFLSADLDSIKSAESYGISPQSTMSFADDADGVKSMYNSVSDRVTCYRAGSDSIEFTDEDRAEQDRS